MPEPSEQHFPDQDLPAGSIQPTGESPTTAGPTGNRPADGAPVTRPDEMTGEDWEAPEGAEDFLGLEGQPSSGPTTPQAAEYQVDETLETASALADAPELEEGAFENWLEDDSEDSASWLMELDEASGDDAFDPERLEAEFGLQAPVTESARGGWILRVTLVAAGLGAGFVGARWYGNHQLRSGETTGTPLARVEQPITRTESNTQPGGTATTGEAAVTATTTEAVTQPTPTETNTGTNTGVATTNTTEPTTDTQATGTDTSMDAATTTTGATPDPFFPEGGGQEAPAPTNADTGATTVAEGESTPTTDDGKSFTMPIEDMVVVPRVESPVRFADQADLSAIWHKREIPLGKISSDKRMLTPQVGRVRLVIHGGEVFEGRLYAVGENKVWLDTGLGKMALLGWQVDRIEHLHEGDAPLPGQEGSENLVGLKRVRVRTPGGVFYGKLLDHHGTDVTLITEDGGRIRLANARVEPAGKSRTRIVDPGHAEAQEAASKNE